VREIRKHGSEGGAAQLNVPFLPLSVVGWLEGCDFIGVYSVGLIRLGRPTSKISLPDNPCGSEIPDKQPPPRDSTTFPRIQPFRLDQGQPGRIGPTFVGDLRRVRINRL
jgi:hypothetical protein